MKKLLCLLLSVSISFGVFASDLELGSGVLHEKSLWGQATELGLGNYLLYVPKTVKKSDSNKLVVLLHGCLQPAKDMFDGSHIQKYADQEGFIVLLPQQSEDANPYYCWNWFFPGNQIKSNPFLPNEPQMIIGMINSVRVAYNVSGREHVYIAGMSAGGAMANIVASCYPQDIGAVASHHGLEFAAAALSWWDMDALKVLGQEGSDVDPEASAYAAFSCAASYTNPFSYLGKSMPSIIFHGTDGYMTYRHARQIEDQMLHYNDYLDNGMRDGSIKYSNESKYYAPETKYAYEKTETRDQNGNLIAERYKIFGLGHSWSGGEANKEYFDTKGPEATKLIVNFFKKFGL